MGTVVPLPRRERDVPDGELVARAKRGDVAAQEALFRRHLPWVVRMAARLVPREDPEDLAQDALVQALDGLKRLGDGQAFPAWLKTIVVRAATWRIRRRKVLERVGLSGGDEPDLDALMHPSVGPHERAEASQLYRQLDALPSEERLALLLRRVEGMELHEVAEAMGLSLATVKRRISAAEEKLAVVREESR